MCPARSRLSRASKILHRSLWDARSRGRGGSCFRNQSCKGWCGSRMTCRLRLWRSGAADMRRIWALAVVLASPLAAAVPPGPMEDAFRDLYNFHFPAAHQTIDRYIAAHPTDPVPYAVRASAYMFYELDRLGILESEFLIDDKKIARKEKAL